MTAGEIVEQLSRDQIPVVPDSVRVQLNGSWTATFTRALTSEEQAKVDALPERLSAYADQLEAYEAFKADGYQDTETGIKLKTTEYAQKKFGQLASVLDLAIRYAGQTEASMTSVWDFGGVERALSYGDCIRLLLRYANHCKSFFDQYAP